MTHALDTDSYRQRQRRLIDGQPGWIFLLGAKQDPRCADPMVHYLTGCTVPGTLVLLRPGETQSAHATAFLPQREPAEERYLGPSPPLPQAAGVVDEAYPGRAELKAVLSAALLAAEVLGYRLGLQRQLDDLVLDRLERHQRRKPRTGRGLMPIHDPTAAVGEQRLIKDPAERQRLREAGRLSAEAHVALMAQLRPGASELEVAARMELELKRRGCTMTSYPTIVASGERGTILHGEPTERTLRSGQLVLIDAAGSVGSYASDITRTIPVGARYTEPQRALYEVVLAAQTAALAKVVAGSTLAAVDRAAREVIAHGLGDLGAAEVTADLVERVFPHQTCHWLGLEAHDAGCYQHGGEARVLEPHMALTVEPGLYIDSAEERLPPALRGQAVRIEDVVLVTADSNAEILTATAPKKVTEIEQLRRGQEVPNSL